MRRRRENTGTCKAAPHRAQNAALGAGTPSWVRLLAAPPQVVVSVHDWFAR